MLTIRELGEQIQDKKKQAGDFRFYADKYTVNIKFTDNTYIYVALENLTNYNRTDRISRLMHYVRQNTNALGYMYSTLAYNNNNDVIVQQWLDKNTSVESLLHAIDYLLVHADMLTNTHY